MITRVRGTEDILDLRLHNAILTWIKAHCIAYNFQEIKTPILEHTELFQRSLGLQTDVVTKEMYTLTTASGDSLCLRPEATASSMRAFLAASITTLPWKIFSYGPMFRHERPQKGRQRQFSQVSIEIIGSNAAMQDVEGIVMLDRFFAQKLSLPHYTLTINFLGSLEDRMRYKEQLASYLATIYEQICSTCQVRSTHNILRTLDCKQESCIQLYRNAPKITNTLSEASQKNWELIQKQLHLFSVSYVHNPHLVRGLDYYNNTVFEFSSPHLGAQSAFCGGGRYDGLAEQLGAKTSVPAFGASIGMERLLMLCELLGDNLTIPPQPPLALVLPMTDAQATIALLLADALRAETICSDVLFDGGSLKSMMRRANKMGARWVLIVGEDEMREGTVSIKNMLNGETTVLPHQQAVMLLKKYH